MLQRGVGMIEHNEEDESLSLIVCDGCNKKLCLVQDLDGDPWAMIGYALQSSNGIKYFCDKGCLRNFCYGVQE